MLVIATNPPLSMNEDWGNHPSKNNFQISTASHTTLLQP